MRPRGGAYVHGLRGSGLVAAARGPLARPHGSQGPVRRGRRRRAAARARDGGAPVGRGGLELGLRGHVCRAGLQADAPAGGRRLRHLPRRPSLARQEGDARARALPRNVCALLVWRERRGGGRAAGGAPDAVSAAHAVRGYEPAVPGVGARWPLQEQPGVHAAELPAVVRRVSDARQRGGGGRQRLRGRQFPGCAYQPLFDAAADRTGVVRVAECSGGPCRPPRGDVRPRRGPRPPLGHSPGPQPPPPHRPAPRLVLSRRHRRGIPPDATAPALPPHPRPPHPPPCHPGAAPRGGGGAAPRSHRRQAGARGPQAKVSTRSLYRKLLLRRLPQV
mmetsp:Transcript_41036/g.133013  ORF Transcript_41036/g.133013 Transcript_41036/m.133013 type:complete len:333 (-) Transcript_41036:145-1143(-)